MIPKTGPMVGGIECTVLGHHFAPGMAVFFGNQEATEVHCWSASTLVCRVPASPYPGEVPVTVLPTAPVSSSDPFLPPGMTLSDCPRTPPHLSSLSLTCSLSLSLVLSLSHLFSLSLSLCLSLSLSLSLSFFLLLVMFVYEDDTERDLLRLALQVITMQTSNGQPLDPKLV